MSCYAFRGSQNSASGIKTDIGKVVMVSWIKAHLSGDAAKSDFIPASFYLKFPLLGSFIRYRFVQTSFCSERDLF